MLNMVHFLLIFSPSLLLPDWCFFCMCFCYQDEEDVKAIARLFADMGDSYVELIATGPYMCHIYTYMPSLNCIAFALCRTFGIWYFFMFSINNFITKYVFLGKICSINLIHLTCSGSEESMLIVHALLEVASHPEFNIASMTFNFWHNLQVNLTRR